MWTKRAENQLDLTQLSFFWSLGFLSLSSRQTRTQTQSVQKRFGYCCLLVGMDWGFVRRAWEKWASINIGSFGEPLKGALLLNYDPVAPSRLLSTIAEQQGLKANPLDLSQFIEFVRRNKLQNETFIIGANEYVVTSIHENWFCARCMNTSKPAGEGAIVMQTAAFLLVALYDGSISAASCAMVAVDQFAWQLGRRNL